jgi:hypothetical protein
MVILCNFIGFDEPFGKSVNNGNEPLVEYFKWEKGKTIRNMMDD